MIYDEAKTLTLVNEERDENFFDLIGYDLNL